MPDFQHFDDPVAAYNHVAAHYVELSRRREKYLRSVENIVSGHIPARSRSLLDVGAGDGIRALRIAQQSGITRVVLAEPSAEMVREQTGSAEIWPLRAENLATEFVPQLKAFPENVATAAASSPRAAGAESPLQPSPLTAENFDVVICLWNVLGHISAEKRADSLSAIATLLSPSGKFFLDVNHRYNLRSYGVVPTIGRFFYDLVFPAQKNGDVVAKWQIVDSRISTYGHVFTHAEIMRLARASGLEIEQRIVIDYENGKVRGLSMMGNLLYIFRRSSRMDSSSAPQTS